MTPHQYHRILVSLDVALFGFHEAGEDLSVEDRKLRDELELIRSQILKAESGHPFPFKKRLPTEENTIIESLHPRWIDSR